MMPRWLSLAAKIAVTLLLLWLLLRRIDLAAAWHAIQTLSPLAFIAAVALLGSQTFICGLRWQLVLRALGARLTLLKTTAVFAIGQFFGLALPGAVGGDVVRMWATRRAGLPLATAVNSVILERGTTVLALVLITTASEPLLARYVPASSLWLFPALAVAGIVGIAVLMILDRLPRSLLEWRLIKGLALLAGDTRKLYLAPGRIGPVMAVSIVAHIGLGLTAYALAYGMHVPISAFNAVILFMPAVLVATLPISVAGWGVREGAMVALYGFVGVPAEQAVAVSILYGLVSTLISLPGGLIWLAERRRSEGAQASS
jgi:uncharacterized membrane protein YbhN (UPF0104 family)